MRYGHCGRKRELSCFIFRVKLRFAAEGDIEPPLPFRNNKVALKRKAVAAVI
jgi:hypothetical protein